MTKRSMGARVCAVAVFTVGLLACDSGGDNPPIFVPTTPTVIPTATAPATDAAPVASVAPGATPINPAAPAPLAPAPNPGVIPEAPAPNPGVIPEAPAPGTPQPVPTPGDGGAAGAPAPEPTAPEPETPAAPEPPPDQGVGDGSDVVTIGDSWMNLGYTGGGIEGAFRRAGKDYRGYAVAGTTLAGSIPGQYDRAKSADPNIATVIMTGGGNDLMFGGCNSESSCAMTLQEIRDTLQTLWSQMADDGVKDVVYILYSDSAGTTNRDNLPDEQPEPVPVCLSGRIRCHVVATTDAVMGSLADGIHPTSAANDRIAAKALEYMEANGIRR